MRSGNRPDRYAKSRRVLASVAAVTLLLAACGADDTSPLRTAGMPDNPACRGPSPAPDASQRGSFEDANLVAGGEMFRIYGADADPLREQVTGEAVEIDGQPAWRLDATVAVTVDGERRSDVWVLWVGFADDEFTVLCADGPDDVSWPPSADPEQAAGR